ncbi:MAG: metal-dependent transcriptional regulator [Vulcanimicrobiaceae bacterium]
MKSSVPAKRPRSRRDPVLEVGSDRSATRAREDYVKAVYQLGDDGPVKAADVARHLGVSPVSVSKAKRSLQRDGLLDADEASTNVLRLTRAGRELAVAMVRRHRLLETFMHRLLGIPLERVHAEAERIEHAISEDIAQRLAELMGNPACDPHGHAIPYSLGEARRSHDPRLTSVSVGTHVLVSSLDDRDAAAVRALSEAGVLPGLRAAVLAGDDQRVVLRCGKREVALSAQHAARVRVVEVPRGRRA